MPNAYIIHGAYGDPEENWIPWLKKELEQQGYTVFVPTFPTPQGQTLENWTKLFSPYEQGIDETSIVIGHSLGVAFLLDVLERTDNKIKAAYFIAGCAELLGNQTFDDINKTFVDRTFDWDKIRAHCEHFIVFHGDDDPYVPLTKAETLAKHLNVEPIIIEHAGHFNEKAGYTTFLALLEAIKKTR